MYVAAQFPNLTWIRPKLAYCEWKSKAAQTYLRRLASFGSMFAMTSALESLASHLRRQRFHIYYGRP